MKLFFFFELELITFDEAANFIFLELTESNIFTWGEKKTQQYNETNKQTKTNKVTKKKVKPNP